MRTSITVIMQAKLKLRGGFACKRAGQVGVVQGCAVVQTIAVFRNKGAES